MSRAALRAMLRATQQIPKAKGRQVVAALVKERFRTGPAVPEAVTKRTLELLRNASAPGPDKRIVVALSAMCSETTNQAQASSSNGQAPKSKRMSADTAAIQPRIDEALEFVIGAVNEFHQVALPIAPHRVVGYVRAARKRSRSR
eukprot:a508853_56.p2 GENE.a508853_56~~a508853_56.p2  ORF type:complete len:157 (+),score=6.59 a508853_56:39-473(+)